MTTLPAPRSSVLFREMEEGAVLYRTDTETYFGLNAVGVQIWRFLEKGSGDYSGLVQAIRDHFPDAPQDQVEPDVNEFLSELEQAGLVSPVQ